MQNNFFQPYVGSRYSEGINGKKVLVIGASFYCDKTSCPFFSRCTDRNLKDSGEFDLVCPEYKEKGLVLHDEPTYCVSEQPKPYLNFGANLAEILGMTQEELWERLAFTNYVQYFLPARNGFAPTRKSDLSQRDFEAFIEVVRVLRPDVIIVWGGVVNSAIKEENPYIVSKSELGVTEYYVCHLNIPGIGHEIAVVNPHHPSSSAWYSDREKFNKYLLDILNSQAISF